MEIALCVIDRSLGSLEIASAKNPVYVFQNENLTVIEGDRVMIGDTKLEEAVFQKYIFSLENVTQIYLASDGLQDQFSSHTNKKLTKRGLRGLLQQIHHKPIQQQAKELETHLLNWQGSESQTDDILVLGVQMQPSNKALSSAM
jgi:serine phosphatase RsbU (regulator of sigma subunit)